MLVVSRIVLRDTAVPPRGNLPSDPNQNCQKRVSISENVEQEVA
jgi:hypothetical protein